MDLGKKIRELRKKHGWTQAQLAARTGMSIHWVHSIESRCECNNPKFGTILRLAKVFRVKVEELTK